MSKECERCKELSLELAREVEMTNEYHDDILKLLDIINNLRKLLLDGPRNEQIKEGMKYKGGV